MQSAYHQMRRDRNRILQQWKQEQHIQRCNCTAIQRTYGVSEAELLAGPVHSRDLVVHLHAPHGPPDRRLEDKAAAVAATIIDFDDEEALAPEVLRPHVHRHHPVVRHVLHVRPAVCTNK